jgi:hypothetical protein
MRWAKSGTRHRDEIGHLDVLDQVPPDVALGVVVVSPKRFPGLGELLVAGPGDRRSIYERRAPPYASRHRVRRAHHENSEFSAIKTANLSR